MKEDPLRSYNLGHQQTWNDRPHRAGPDTGSLNPGAYRSPHFHVEKLSPREVQEIPNSL